MVDGGTVLADFGTGVHSIAGRKSTEKMAPNDVMQVKFSRPITSIIGNNIPYSTVEITKPIVPQLLILLEMSGYSSPL